MPPYFFLSCAQADDGPAVRRFFRDLSNEIRVREKLPDTEIVGCSGVEHFENRDEGLRTSRMMLALISPNYLRDHAAESDWHTFERRKARITRINWSRHYEPLPQVLASTPVFPQQLNGNRYAPLAVMIAAIGKYKAQYEEFVNNLADYIIASAASAQLSNLDLSPDEVSTTFKDREEPDMKSQPTNPSANRKIKNLNQNFLIIDGTFFKTVAEQMKETAGNPKPPDFPDETTEPRVVNEKYRVVAIDHDLEYVKRIETTATFSREFDVTGYTDANQLLSDVSALDDQQKPDLIVLNPELVLSGTRKNLIVALLDKKVSSAILAITQNPDTAHALEAAGINDLVAILPKPFTSVDLLQRMRHWAKIGREKRLQRGRSDPRIAFLSYSGNDRSMAGRICKWLDFRDIGVWYSIEALAPGMPWKEEVSEGLNHAEVFIALISDNYPESMFCEVELGVILDRMPQEAQDLHVIPVLYNSPTKALEDSQIKRCLNQHAVTISDDEWLPGLQQILESVQNFLKRRQNQS